MKEKVFTTLRAVFVCGLMAGVQGGQSAATGGATPTFSKDVAPVLYKNCTICHRPGAIAPMSLLTYKDARPWAMSIRNQVARGAMPPWHADPAHGEFLNDRRLSDAEKNTIVQWASAGAPEGNPADLPPQPTYPEGWAIGSPDAVFSLPEDYPVPAEGTIAYQYFEIPTNLTEDKWIQAMELRAGDPAVVHHVIVYARLPQPESEGVLPFKFDEGQSNIPAGQTDGPALPPEQRKPLGPNDRPERGRRDLLIALFAPGQTIRVFQESVAMRLPAGSVLILQMHYTPAGKETTDRTRMGFKFATERPQLEARCHSLINGSLHIPAGASDHRVDAEMTMMQDVTLWSMLPHTHVRGKRWEYQATYPDGRTEVILSVPKYDFNWQTDYIFKQPMQLPKGTTIRATAWYDNSKNNPSNPDATKDVWWGDQTWEEMMFTGLIYSVAPAPTTLTADAHAHRGRQSQKRHSDWEGTLKAGAAELRLVLHVAKDEKGGLEATLDSIDRNAMGIPVTSISLTDSTLKFEIQQIGGSYEGKVNPNRTAVSGTWTQGGSSLPLEFARAKGEPVLPHM